MIYVSNIKRIYFKHIHTTIIFGVTVVNADRKVGKIMVSVQIIAKMARESSSPCPLSKTPQLALTQNI